jgi:hypothetical protein
VAALISIILITGSPFQITNNLLTNNENFPIKIIGQDVYGQGDDGGEETMEAMIQATQTIREIGMMVEMKQMMGAKKNQIIFLHQIL